MKMPVLLKKRTMDGPIARLFELIDWPDGRIGVDIAWSDPPRLSEWARFVLQASLFVCVSLLLLPLSLLFEVWHPCLLGQRWRAALLLLSLKMAVLSILLDFIVSPTFKAHIAIPLGVGAFVFLRLAMSLAFKQRG